MLLIGNQGCGKNKLVDMFCQLLLLPREYMQLHRDTTVSSLLQTPVLTAGAIAHVPSPLAVAAVSGRVCVVDEADKAGAEVVGVLRGLVEDGELLLPDGTRIVDFERYPQWRAQHERSLARGERSSVLPLHPDFRLLVLANRPGFPFLGNDLFRACGDVLSLHTVEAPDAQSELMLLHAYAPDVDRLVLDRLVRAFAWLRAAAEEGRVDYPYSTRELVNIARHLQQFPQDSVQAAVANTVAFDFWNGKVLALLCEGFTKYAPPHHMSPCHISSARHTSLIGLTSLFTSPPQTRHPDGPRTDARPGPRRAHALGPARQRLLSRAVQRSGRHRRWPAVRAAGGTQRRLQNKLRWPYFRGSGARRGGDSHERDQ